MINRIRGIATYVFFLSLFYIIINKIFLFIISVKEIYISIGSIVLSFLIVCNIIKVNWSKR